MSFTGNTHFIGLKIWNTLNMMITFAWNLSTCWGNPATTKCPLIYVSSRWYTWEVSPCMKLWAAHRHIDRGIDDFFNQQLLWLCTWSVLARMFQEINGITSVNIIMIYDVKGLQTSHRQNGEWWLLMGDMKAFRGLSPRHQVSTTTTTTYLTAQCVARVIPISSAWKSETPSICG